ncbi:unnamed protein product [Lampetra fluviatilis]
MGRDASPCHGQRREPVSWAAELNVKAALQAEAGWCGGVGVRVRTAQANRCKHDSQLKRQHVESGLIVIGRALGRVRVWGVRGGPEREDWGGRIDPGTELVRGCVSRSRSGVEESLSDTRQRSQPLHSATFRHYELPPQYF